MGVGNFYYSGCANKMFCSGGLYPLMVVLYFFLSFFLSVVPSFFRGAKELHGPLVSHYFGCSFQSFRLSFFFRSFYLSMLRLYLLHQPEMPYPGYPTPRYHCSLRQTCLAQLLRWRSQVPRSFLPLAKSVFVPKAEIPRIPYFVMCLDSFLSLCSF